MAGIPGLPSDRLLEDQEVPVGAYVRHEHGKAVPVVKYRQHRDKAAAGIPGLSPMPTAVPPTQDLGRAIPEAVSASSPELGHERNALDDKVLGKGVADTVEKHTQVGYDGVRRYTPERTAEHKQWIAEVLAGHEENRKDPHILFTAGGPASGKSSIIEPKEGEKPKTEIPDDAVHLDQDIFKAKISEYRDLSGTDENGDKVKGATKARGSTSSGPPIIRSTRILSTRAVSCSTRPIAKPRWMSWRRSTARSRSARSRRRTRSKLRPAPR